MQLKKQIGVKYPTKTTINLASTGKGTVNGKTAVPAALVLAAVVIAFAKIGVIDRLNSLNRAESAKMQAQAQLEDVQKLTADYDEVLLEYNTISTSNAGSGVIATVPERIKIVNDHLVSAAAVESFNVFDDVITASISGVTLDEISVIYTSLMADEFVDSVQIYTAGTQADGSELTAATMTVILKTDGNAQEGGEAQ